MSARERLIEAGFPSVAAHLDGTDAGVHRAWRELRRFEPLSFGEAEAKARARALLPEPESEDA